MEILNEKVHIIAEGMGAIVALKLLQDMNASIRSIILINPILSLKYHLELEKDRKFFYKRLIKELEFSHEMKFQELLEKIQDSGEYICLNSAVPIKIIHVLSDNRSYKQSQFLKELSVKWDKAKRPFSICYMVPEKKQQLPKQMIQFFKLHEEI